MTKDRRRNEKVYKHVSITLHQMNKFFGMFERKHAQLSDIHDKSKPFSFDFASLETFLHLFHGKYPLQGSREGVVHDNVKDIIMGSLF
jgi:hypothetical protein